MKKIYKGLAGIFSAGILLLLAGVLSLQATLPDRFYAAEGEEFRLRSPWPVSAKAQGDSIPAAVGDNSRFLSAELFLWGNIAIKTVDIQVVPRRLVIPGGTPFGIKMFTKGVIVVGMSDIQTGRDNVNPAKEAGIKIGDILLQIDGHDLESNEDVERYIAGSGGAVVPVALLRGDIPMEVTLQPVKTEYDGRYKAGIWVRDSSAGIGTMTYIKPDSLCFAGLGHAICDVDTGRLMPLSSGEIIDMSISGVQAGTSGKPGELRSNFAGGTVMGHLQRNTERGIFGRLLYHNSVAEAVPMALKQEVVPGPAVILATLSGTQPQEFDIVIEKINYLDDVGTKNMVIRITDPQLLTTAGGIVQGMSGSPILQEGLLAGAVTHVFVNDPTRGYGIFAENMEEELNFVEKC